MSSNTGHFRLCPKCRQDPLRGKMQTDQQKVYAKVDKMEKCSKCGDYYFKDDEQQ